MQLKDFLYFRIICSSLFFFWLVGRSIGRCVCVCMNLFSCPCSHQTLPVFGLIHFFYTRFSASMVFCWSLLHKNNKKSVELLYFCCCWYCRCFCCYCFSVFTNRILFFIWNSQRNAHSFRFTFKVETYRALPLIMFRLA